MTQTPMRWWYRLARAHPALPFLIWSPLVALALFRSLKEGAPATTALLFGLGAFLWTLAEYLIHRYFLHVRGGAWARRLNYLVHGLHHNFPTDSYIVVFPVAVVLPITVGVYLACRWAVPGPEHLALWAGVTASYLHSDWTHWSVHHREPRSFLGRHQRVRHLSHHFVDDRVGFGIGTGLWDRVFRTGFRPLPPEADVREYLSRVEGPFDFQEELASEGFRGFVSPSLKDGES